MEGYYKFIENDLVEKREFTADYKNLIAVNTTFKSDWVKFSHGEIAMLHIMETGRNESIDTFHKLVDLINKNTRINNGNKALGIFRLLYETMTYYHEEKKEIILPLDESGIRSVIGSIRLLMPEAMILVTVDSQQMNSLALGCTNS